MLATKIPGIPRARCTRPGLAAASAAGPRKNYRHLGHVAQTLRHIVLNVQRMKLLSDFFTSRLFLKTRSNSIEIGAIATFQQKLMKCRGVWTNKLDNKASENFELEEMLKNVNLRDLFKRFPSKLCRINRRRQYSRERASESFSERRCFKQQLPLSCWLDNLHLGE